MRDLKRYLRYGHETDPEKKILLALGEWDVLRKDIIPIFLKCHRGNNQDEELICNACGIIPFAFSWIMLEILVELFVPLTWPLTVVEEKAIELRHVLLWQYKMAFVSEFPNFFEAFFFVFLRRLSQRVMYFFPYIWAKL